MKKPIGLVALAAVALAFFANPSKAATAAVAVNVKQEADEGVEPVPPVATATTPFLKRELAAGSMSLVPYNAVSMRYGYDFYYDYYDYDAKSSKKSAKTPKSSNNRVSVAQAGYTRCHFPFPRCGRDETCHRVRFVNRRGNFMVNARGVCVRNGDCFPRDVWQYTRSWLENPLETLGSKCCGNAILWESSRNIFDVVCR